MPNAQQAPPTVDSVDMDLDETTFVTMVTTASPRGSPARASDAVSVQTPGGVRLPHTHVQYADDEQSDSPAVPSPSFSGFHSARSSPGTRLGTRYRGETEENNLDGHTLVGESQSLLADTSNQDPSALSFLSANQSMSEQPSESQQQDRQVVDESLAPTTGSDGNGADSLLSVVPLPGDGHDSAKYSPARSAVEESPEAGKGSNAWKDILDMLRSGQPEQDNTDQDKDEPNDLNDDREDHDSLIHSEQSPLLSPRPSPQVPSSRSSRKPSPSAQRPPSRKSNPESPLEEPTTTSTRSQRKHNRPSDSQPNNTQTSEMIDLTMSSPAPSHSDHEKSRDHGPGWVPKPESDEDILPQSSGSARTSTGKIQHMQEVSVSPKLSQKKSKKRSSRKS